VRLVLAGSVQAVDAVLQVEFLDDGGGDTPAAHSGFPGDTACPELVAEGFLFKRDVDQDGVEAAAQALPLNAWGLSPPWGLG
jgi:hypothetical protein